MNHLDGVRVLDLGHYIAGPGTCAVLASLGAEVIKVEPLGGETARHIAGGEMAKSFSHSRRSLAIDLKRPEGQHALERLLASSDVVVHNLRPGSAGHLGLDPEALAARHPRLISATLTGYPSDGSSAMRPGYDIAAQAGSGLMWVTGAEGGTPQPVGAAIVDVTATHVAAEAVIAALYRRERTGLGDTIEVSLLEVAVAMQAQRFGLFGATGVPPIRNGGCQTNVAPASEVVDTSDGYIVFSAYLDEHWDTLCRILDRPDVHADPRFTDAASRVAHRGELLQALQPTFHAHTSASLVALLAAAGLVAEIVRDYPAVAQADDVRSSGLLLSAVGGATVMGLPYRSATARRRTPTPLPAAGQHSHEILAELGFGDSDIAALIATNVVAGATVDA